MRYQGGKSRLAQYIVPILEAHRQPGQIYLEPFVGSGAIVSRMSGVRIASDSFEPVIALHRALQQGWEPPTSVSPEEYHQARLGNAVLPMHLLAFILLGCSWGGKWAGGYARGESRNYAEESARSLRKIADGMKDVALTTHSYTKFDPKGMLIYCDPPYEGTTEYKTAEFDSDLFWTTMKYWAQNNTVIVSERKAPSFTVCLWTHEYQGGIRRHTPKEPERLFLVTPF